jgi:hypothetical protein
LRGCFMSGAKCGMIRLQTPAARRQRTKRLSRIPLMIPELA